MWYRITQLAVYTTYIPLIYCQLADYPWNSIDTFDSTPPFHHPPRPSCLRCFSGRQSALKQRMAPYTRSEAAGFREQSVGHEKNFLLGQWQLFGINYTWNPNGAPCFGWKRPCFGGLTFKNRGHWGSRYTYLVGKMQFKLLFQGPMAKWGMNIHNSPENWRKSPWKGSILKGNYSISSNYQFSGGC